MNDIIIVNKPKGITSYDVIRQIKHIFKTSKVGHTGTLDPLATGVLVIGLGKSLKIVDILTAQSKEYIVKVRLGLTTDTYDITGTVMKTSQVFITKDQLKKVLSSFKGHQKQEVPIYSAVKVNGKKLYEYARNKQQVILPIKDIYINDINLISDLDNNEFMFKCNVSKGTYIRSIVNDLGKKLGCGATMLELTRTRQGNFKLDDATTIEEIEHGNYQSYSILEVLSYIPKIDLDEQLYNKVRNGAIIGRVGVSDQIILLYKKQIVALYQTYSKDNTKMKPLKMFI